MDQNRKRRVGGNQKKSFPSRLGVRVRHIAEGWHGAALGTVLGAQTPVPGVLS